MKEKSLTGLTFAQRTRIYRAQVKKSQQKIIDINEAARAAGMTYGKYVAMMKEVKK